MFLVDLFSEQNSSGTKLVWQPYFILYPFQISEQEQQVAWENGLFSNFSSF